MYCIAVLIALKNKSRPPLRVADPIATTLTTLKRLGFKKERSSLTTYDHSSSDQPPLDQSSLLDQLSPLDQSSLPLLDQPLPSDQLSPDAP